MLGNRLPILHVEMANGMTNREMRHKEILGRSNGPKNGNKLHVRAMLLPNSLEKLAEITVRFSREISTLSLCLANAVSYCGCGSLLLS